MHDGAIFLSGVGLLLAMMLRYILIFDKIVVLSPNCKMGMIRKIPSLSDKIVVISNLIDGEKITRLSEEDCFINIDTQILNFVTVARIDHKNELIKFY